MREIRNQHTNALKARVNVYDSPAEVFGLIEAGGYHYGQAGSWSQGSAQAIAEILAPAPRHMMEEVETLLEQIDSSVAGRERREYIAGPAGAYAVVPEYLQGMPYNMRRRAPVESDTAPLRLVIEASMGGYVTNAQITRRGAAMAALVSRLSETRPVELYMAWADRTSGYTGTTYNTVGMVRMETAPLNMNEMVNMLCRPDFGRGVTFAIDKLQATNPTASGFQWAWGLDPEEPARIARVRTLLQLEPQDIFITGGSNITAEEYMRDPVKWINKFLDPQRTVDA